MNRKFARSLVILLILLIRSAGVQAQSSKAETGIASYYHDKFIGRKTANGEIFSQEKYTAAHKTLPLGTWVRVINLSNDSVVIVRVNDRMPVWNKRSIDLTEAAARQLNYISNGVAKVRIEIIPAPTGCVFSVRPLDLPIIPIIPVKPQIIQVPSAVNIPEVHESIGGVVFTQNQQPKKRHGNRWSDQ